MYIALRSMKVQGEDGVVRVVQPGEEIPEADGWKNLQKWINRGFVGQEGTPIQGRGPLPKVVHKQEAPKNEAPKGDSEGGEGESGDGGEGESGDPATNPGDAALTEKQLMKLGKPELQEMADSMGVNPDQNKAELVSSIIAAAQE